MQILSARVRRRARVHNGAEGQHAVLAPAHADAPRVLGRVVRRRRGRVDIFVVRFLARGPIRFRHHALIGMLRQLVFRRRPAFPLVGALVVERVHVIVRVVHASVVRFVAVLGAVGARLDRLVDSGGALHVHRVGTKCVPRRRFFRRRWDLPFGSLRKQGFVHAVHGFMRHVPRPDSKLPSRASLLARIWLQLFLGLVEGLGDDVLKRNGRSRMRLETPGCFGLCLGTLDANSGVEQELRYLCYILMARVRAASGSLDSRFSCVFILLLLFHELVVVEMASC